MKWVRGIALAGALVSLCAAGCGHASVPATATARKSPAAASKADAPRIDQFWARAKQESYKSVEELTAQHAREVRKGLHYDKLVRGDPAVRAVALTFDDGPHPGFTPQILAILKQYDAKGTFFLVGEMAQKYPEQARAEQAAGHVIGNHTYHHVNLTRIPLREIATEWQACQDVVKSITGETMRFCRPPGGDYDSDVIRAAMATGLTTVLWTDDPGDYASPGDKVIERRVLDRIGNGGIILLHDGVQQTVDVLPQIIKHLKSKGYRFVTVSEMQAQLSGGKVHKSAHLDASPKRETACFLRGDPGAAGRWPLGEGAAGARSDAAVGASA
jgi:peptidoglycan/xylan/chitin deacetylase (PgdA/CDA1 family)